MTIAYHMLITCLSHAGIDPYEAAKKENYYKAKLVAIDSYLSAQLGSYSKKGITKYSLQFKCNGVSIDVLLSPYFTSMGNYCSFLDEISRQHLPTAM